MYIKKWQNVEKIVDRDEIFFSEFGPQAKKYGHLWIVYDTKRLEANVVLQEAIWYYKFGL